MATTFLDRQKKALIKKYHVLAAKAGMDEDARKDFLSSFGATSSKDLNAHDLIEVCNILDKQVNPTAAELDLWRKRVIASIGGYLRQVGLQGNNVDYIKGIACQSAGCKYFNKISIEKLRSIYYTFLNKQKVANSATIAIEEIVNEIKTLN